MLSILKRELSDGEPTLVVASARGDATDVLEQLLDDARAGREYAPRFHSFKAYQTEPLGGDDGRFEEVFKRLDDILAGVRLTKDYSLKVKDEVLAQGELLSAAVLQMLLARQGVKSMVADARIFLKTDSQFGNAEVNQHLSGKLTRDYLQGIPADTLPIIPGFIASNEQGETTTLGRNGSNYSASLVANYLDACRVVSYTDVDGILTANPNMVRDVQIIRQLNFVEAHELASFGVPILHPKTIGPLMEKGISLHIKNTFAPFGAGTHVNGDKTPEGIKCISTQDKVALINIEGKGLLGKIGVDARIFTALGAKGISVGMVSQGSSERAVSFVVSQDAAVLARQALLREFKWERSKQDIWDITCQEDVAAITIIGQRIEDFHSSLAHLKQNHIPVLLTNSTISRKNIGIVIPRKDLTKAAHIIHSQIFGALKLINIAIIGKGTVGGALIQQILSAKAGVERKKSTRLNLFAIAGSRKALLASKGIGENWQEDYGRASECTDVTQEIISYAKKHHLENLIAIDNTASTDFTANYVRLVENGFDLVSSNKIANTQSHASYKAFREVLRRHNKEYLYETNVGAGLPIMDTIKLLHASGENITRIKGVFSGSLSFLFNSFSASDQPFSHFLQEAIRMGYTEPDPREDLCGNDVARKLLILARELDLENEFEDIDIENLIPKKLRAVDKDEFLQRLEELDGYFASLKTPLGASQALRYVGDLSGDLQQAKGNLSVKLVAVEKNSAMGNLKGSDSIIEIYTESYGKNPITIIGAGAGAEVTARGVFGDLLRISDKK